MQGVRVNSARLAWLIVGGLMTFLVAFAAGCGSSDDSTTASSDLPTSVGKGEGELNLVNWAGYVEDGTDYGPKYDWVTPFEKQTGCQVSYKEAGTSDEMVKLMRTGQYDGVSASGNATARLVAGGDVDPVNVDLISNYADVFPDLKDQPYNTFDGVHYGVPHGRGANLLMWNTDDVKPAPTSWDVMLDPNKAAQYSGKISAYDDPIYIADAAVYLKAHQPDLGIDNPYELDEDQFNAAVDLLKQQRPNVGEYWSSATKQIQAFTNGDDQVGTTWQYQYFILKGDGQPIASSPASAGLRARGGRDRMVGHVDALVGGSASELHVPVDELRALAEGPGADRGVLRRGAGQPEGLRLHQRPEVLRQVPRRRHGVLEARLLLEHPARRLRRRPRRDVHGLQRLGLGLDRDQGVALVRGSRWR